MRVKVMVDERLCLLEVPEALGRLLGIAPSDGEPVAWRRLVLEDISDFLPGPEGRPAQKIGHLRQAKGEPLEAVIACERIDARPSVFSVEIQIGEESGETSGADATSGTLDAGALQAYVGYMRNQDEETEHVVAKAVAILDSEMECLLAALAKGVLQDVEKWAHSLKGALGLLGALSVSELVSGLEVLARSERSLLRAEHWERLLKQAYANYKRELKAYLEGVKGDEG